MHLRIKRDKKTKPHSLSIFPLSGAVWEGGPGHSARVNLTISLHVSLQPCAAETRDSRSCNSININTPLQKLFFPIRPAHRPHSGESPVISLSCWAMKAAKLTSERLWPMEKTPRDRTNKVSEAPGISSQYLFLVFECRSPTKWWIDTGFARLDI